MIFPGIPAVGPSGAGEKPMETSPATRTVTMELSCDKSVGAESTASVSVPEGLKVGKTVVLHIDRSKPVEAAKQAELPKVKQLAYWGSSEKIPKGQPKVTEPGSAAQDAVKVSGEVLEALSVVPKVPSGSFAYWPDVNSEPLVSDITAPGTYALSTNYCGKTWITLGNEQEFLAPIELVNLPESFDFEKPIKIEWKPVPEALGYVVNAYGGNEKESIAWTCGSTSNPPMNIDYWAVSKKDVQQFIEKGILLPPTATTCTIPAGVFKGAKTAVLTMTALGADRIQDKDEIQTQVVVRSTTSVPLFTKPYSQPEVPAAEGNAQ